MARLRTIGLWSFAAVAVLAWIPYSACGSSSKAAIKLVKPHGELPPKKISATRRQQTVSGEDDEEFSGQRPSFRYGGIPFSPGFSQSPPRYFNRPDAPSDRYDLEDSPAESENAGMGFMSEFGPPKGFPDLSKLTDGEFGKMDAPAGGGSHENSRYSSPQEGPRFRPFPQFAYSPGGPSNYYEESDDGPSEGPGSGGPGNLAGPNSAGSNVQNALPQSAPKRQRPFRSGRPSFRGNRPGFGGGGGAGGPGGPGPYGAPEGIGGSYGGSDGLSGSGPYGGGGPGVDGPPRSYGASGRPGPFGDSSDGPSRNPFASNSDGPSRPSGNPFASNSEGPSRPSGNPFGGSLDGPSRPGNPFGGSSDGPPRGGPFGSSSDGPPRGGPFGGSSDGPPRGGPFGSSSSDGPPRGGPFGGSSDGPSRPGPYDSSDGPRGGPFGGGPDGPSGSGPFGSSSSSGGPSRPIFFNSEGGQSRPSGNPFGSLDGPSNGPYGGSDGPSKQRHSFSGIEGPSRPGPFSSSDSRPGPSFSSLDGPPRQGPGGSFGGQSSRPGPFGAPGSGRGGPGGPGNFGGPDTAHSFVNQGPPNQGFRSFNRGYPRYHPNTIPNDDFKESADNENFSPYNGPPQYNNYPPPPRNSAAPQGGFRSEESFDQGPYQNDGPPRGRRPEFSAPPQPHHHHHHHQNHPHHQLGSLLGGPTHRQDSANKRPIVLKANDYPGDDEAQAKYIVKSSRVKRDVAVDPAQNATSISSPCKSKDAGCNKGSASSSVKSKKSARKSTQPAKVVKEEKSVGSEDPMIADGTQQTGFWEVAPAGYGNRVYNRNTYKKQDTGVSDDDRNDEYELEDDIPTAPAAPPLRSSRKNQTTYLDPTSDEQRFFPSFPAPAPYLNPFSSGGGGGFARPPLFPGPTANRAPSRFHPQFGPKYTSPPPNRGPSSAYPAESHDRYLHTNLLGSGNFEVVRGGTYYGDDDDGYHHTGGSGNSGGHYHQDDDDGYFHHNGHSSPHGYRNNPSAGGGDFFANFRDFADINPPSRSFSHHHETVADAEPHGSASHSIEQPKNILDKLESSSDHIEVHQAFSSRDNDPMMATF